MIRTQVYITKQQHQHLKTAAIRAGVSVSEQVRSLLDVVLRAEDTPIQRAPRVSTGAFLKSLAKRAQERGESGPADLSSRLDTYLYGKDFR